MNECMPSTTPKKLSAAKRLEQMELDRAKQRLSRSKIPLCKEAQLVTYMKLMGGSITRDTSVTRGSPMTLVDPNSWTLRFSWVDDAGETNRGVLTVSMHKSVRQILALVTEVIERRNRKGPLDSPDRSV